MSLLQVKNLNLFLDGKKILDNLSLDVWEGHVHALVGPNGAGKSTLAFTIMGLSGYQNIQGDIIYKGESITHMGLDERARKGITLAWQEPARFEGLKVKDYLKVPSHGKDKKTLEQVLNQVGLEPANYLNRAVDKTLSGGERKKIELASILAMKPRIALLDEPDSGIDVESLEKIFEAVKILKKDGTTVVLITHSLAVLKQAEHAFLICCGRLLKKGTIDKISRYFGEKCIPCDHKNRPQNSQQGSSS
ncbi:ABC transporter ATP-binding protein [bacterium]|nr:ABC transporter ATP-binding protein [bacterium]